MTVVIINSSYCEVDLCCGHLLLTPFRLVCAEGHYFQTLKIYQTLNLSNPQN